MVVLKKIRVPLSVKGLQELQDNLSEIKSSLVMATEELVVELADYGKSKVDANYSASMFTDGNDDVQSFSEATEKGHKFGARGTQVTYREFGTGTEGASNPHPSMNGMGLSAYNSGKTIRRATDKVFDRAGVPVGILYWTYKDKGGNIVFTTGIPAGMEVYNAAKAVKQSASLIAAMKVSDVLLKI